MTRVDPGWSMKPGTRPLGRVNPGPGLITMVGWCHHAFLPWVGSEKTFSSCSFFHGMGPQILEILKFRPLKFSFINTNVYLKKWPVVLRKKNTYNVSLKVKNQLKIIFVFLWILKIKKIFNISFYHQIKSFDTNMI